MLALSISIALALFFFLTLSVLALKRFGEREVKRRLDTFRDETEEEEEETGEDDLKKIPLYQRTVGRLLAHVMEFLSNFAPSSMPKLMEKRIMLAGKQGIWKVRTVVGIWFFSMIFCGLMGFYYTTKNPMDTVQGLCVVWGSFLFGALLPFGVFNHIIRKRQDLIVRQLPDVLDLLSISVQAGLSLYGPMRLMAKRCDVQDVYLFVMSVVQSERLGASMSDTLVIQADNMRDLRRQRARTQAMKAPVKMVFPLVFCIFPAIFVVVLLPSLISLMQTMGK